LTATGHRVDTGAVKTTPPSLTAHLGPAPGDGLELVDPSTARPLSAVVEAVGDDGCAIRFRTPSRLRGRTRARWFDGEDAWQAAAAVHPGSAGDRADLEVVEEWEPVAARQSVRVPVDRFPLLVETVKSDAHGIGRRFDLVCVDVSATGCRATTPGRGPAPGDRVRVAWVRGDEYARIAPEWVQAVVTRAEARPFGGGRVGFRFDLADEAEAARVRVWRDAWASLAANADGAAEASELEELARV